MEANQLYEKIVAKDLFRFKTDASLLEQSQYLIDQCHPAATKMKLISLGADLSEADIPYGQENRALHGFLHGGAYFTVGDTMTAIMCMFYIEKETERMLTANASIRYLRPVERDTVKAKARLTKRDGNKLDFVCDFFNEQNKRAAQAKYTYFLVDMSGKSGAA